MTSVVITTRVITVTSITTVFTTKLHKHSNNEVYKTAQHDDGTGVCKINGVVIVVDCCYSIVFSITNNNKNTVYFASTGII